MAVAQKGVDVRQTGTSLLFRAFLQTSAGALLGTGTATLSLIEYQSDGTVKTYDFNDNTFKTTACTTPTLALTHRPSNNAATTTGIWTAALNTLSGFTVGGIYTVLVNNSGASPTDQAREFQYGGDQGDLAVTAGATGVAYLQDDLTLIKTQTVTCAGGVTVPAATLASTTNITAGTIANVTNDVGITQAAADKAWSTATRVLTAGTNIALAKGVGVTGFNDITAAAAATAVWQDITAGDFTVASSIGKTLYINNAVPGATGGLAIVGSAMTLAASQHVIVDSGTVTTVSNQLTAAQIATGVWQDAVAGDFTTASSIGKALYIANVVPGAAGGHFIAGTNAATTVTTAFTTTFTGNLTGSVASVTGAVGSVVGAVGSVTAIVTANLTQIDGLATSGNNATLNLKQLNLLNSAGDALVCFGNGGVGARFSGTVAGCVMDGSGTGPDLIWASGGLSAQLSAGNCINLFTSHPTADAVVIVAGGDGNAVKLDHSGAGSDLLAPKITADLFGKIIGSGATAITGVGARVFDDQGNAVGTAANQTTLLNRIGAFTGTGINTILGFFRALFRKDSPLTPSDVGGTFDNTLDSVQAIRDRGDVAWVTATSVTVSDKTGFSLASTGLDLVMVAGKTLPNAVRYIGATVAGTIANSQTNTETFHDFAGSVAVTITVDSTGNRSVIVYG